MEVHEFAALGFIAASICSVLLLSLSLALRKSGRVPVLLALAFVITFIWSAALASMVGGHTISQPIIVVLELARGLAWLCFLAALLAQVESSALLGRIVSPLGLGAMAIALVPAAYYSLSSSDGWSVIAITAGGYAVSVLIIVLAEQIFRDKSLDTRSGLNYVSLSLAGLFAYDLLIYIQRISDIASAWPFEYARGFVNCLMLVPLGFGISRFSRSGFEEIRPRQIAFHAVSLTSLGVIVILAIAGQYYVRVHGGAWGEVAAIVFVVGVAAAVATLLASASIRARVRVGLTKTFFAYKYDYRKEWLRFIATLSASATEKVPTIAVRAVAQIVNSPGGVVWVQNQEGGEFLPAGSWHYTITGEKPIYENSALIQFLQDSQWIIDTEEMKRSPTRYKGLRLEDIIEMGGDWWIVVPMFLGNRLLGFITLKRPALVPRLNFEDHDLLRTVGRHVAMHINQAESDRRLAESGQFGAYNRLTAFLMHDLNNLIAQQSLVVKNAERFRHDARFVDDAIDTIANCVSRMTRLMEQLSSGSKIPQKEPNDVRKAVTRAAKRCNAGSPKPKIDVGESPLHVLADMERLTTVFEHLIRNAQDATATDGEITVSVESENESVKILIRDTGSGMTPDFVRERLFTPFDSTKGSESMGIGAYQARDYVRTLGGQIEVSSQPGHGTTFKVRLPALDGG